MGDSYGYLETKEPSREEDEDEGDYDERYERWRENREILQPEPVKFETPAKRLNKEVGDSYEFKPDLDLRRDFGRLQIIVKLANIHLTPEKPIYEGGSWHVEGQANESM